MKVLSPRVHAPLDYVIVALFALAPTLFGFGGVPATLCYGVAGLYLIMSLLTAYPFGVAKIIPFPIHGYVELASTVALIGIPWVFGFNDVVPARNFFIAMGASAGVIWALTDYRAAERDASEQYMIPPDFDRGSTA